MDIADIIPEIAQHLGIQPSSLVFWLGIVTFLANTTARYIPQDATGWQGTVRKIAAIIGVYVPSRVSAGVSVTDVAKAVVADRIEDVKKEVIEKASVAPALIPVVTDAIEAEAEKVIPAFPGLIGVKEEDDDDAR